MKRIRQMRIFLSGPMTGKPYQNRPAFDAAENRLSEQRHFVINPVNISVMFGTKDELAASFAALYRLEDGTSTPLDDKEAKLARAVMDANLTAVRSCYAIYLLRGWENSRGTIKVLAEALVNGLTVMLEGGAK